MIYPFKCKTCDHYIEIQASIKEHVPIPDCIHCGMKMKRVYLPPQYSVPEGVCGNAKNGYNDPITLYTGVNRKPDDNRH